MAQIIIDFTPQGQLGLKMSQDCAQNIVLTLGMIEFAKKAVLDQHQQNQNLIQPASGPLPPAPKL
ncbi:MAG: hypothetical protein V4498_03225 [candidate division FCPU426 bacterium]